MSDFRFKHFTVRNDKSAMKVNTDGVLLGAAVSLDSIPGNLSSPLSRPAALDVGTGTGTIALMLAQRCPDLEIDAIDIDEPSALEAAENFASSPWGERLHAHHCALDDFAPGDVKYSLIISNPPYFDDSLQNPDTRKCEARHSMSLSYRSLAAKAAALLQPGGVLAMVLPADAEKQLVRTLRSFGLQPLRIIRIRSSERKAVSRIIVESVLSDTPAAVNEEELTISKCGGGYSEEYLSLTGDFYLFA